MSLLDTYRKLFGKDHLKDGSVIELAEHGRAGGLSSGQGYKFTKTVDETKIIDKASDTVTYIGCAIAGSNTAPNTADARWKIKKIDSTSNPTIVVWADGDTEYDNIFDNRASLSYS